MEFFQEDVDFFFLGFSFGKFGFEFADFLLGGFVPLNQAAVLLFVYFRLDGNVGVLIDALAYQFGRDFTFLDQPFDFGFDFSRVADRGYRFLTGGDDFLFVLNAGVERTDESGFDFFLRKVRSVAGCVAVCVFIFVVAPF